MSAVTGTGPAGTREPGAGGVPFFTQARRSGQPWPQITRHVDEVMDRGQAVAILRAQQPVLLRIRPCLLKGRLIAWQRITTAP